MMVSTKGRYALRVLIDLALHPTDESLDQRKQMHDGRQQIINLNSLLSI